MKTFLVLAEVQMDEKKYKEVQSWNIEPTDFIVSVLADHGRDRGLLIKMRSMEVEYHLLEDVCKSAEKIAQDKAFAEIELAIMADKLCIGGNCEA